MAGILNSVYLVLAVGIAVVGLGAVIKLVSDSNGNSRWLELSSVVVAAVFLLALGLEMLA
jgi:TRAP-type mannitol/chloroaromatic compound transport system permease small subunit